MALKPVRNKPATSRQSSPRWRRRYITFSYVFIGAEEPFLFGRIGRQIREVTSTGPDEKLAEQQEQVWQAANITIDTSGDPDGQKLAFQKWSRIGSPAAISESLINHINHTNPDKGWLISVRAITESKEFWDAAKQSKGRITHLEFTFVAPNIFGGADKTRAALRRHESGRRC